MATATVQPNGSTPAFKIVERLDQVPVVHDSVAYAQYLVNSTPLTAHLYQTALGVATRGYDYAKPVISRAEPLLKTADNLAVSTLNRVETSFPSILTPTQDIAGVKQAKAVYDARVAPLVQQATPVLQEVLNKTAAINHELGARVATVVNQSTEISHALVEQLNALKAQGKELPHQLLEGLTKVTTDVKSIVLAKDGTVQEKGNKLGAYVVEQVKPIVDDIYRHVLGAKKAAEDKIKAATSPTEKAAPTPSEKKAYTGTEAVAIIPGETVH